MLLSLLEVKKLSNTFNVKDIQVLEKYFQYERLCLGNEFTAKQVGKVWESTKCSSTNRSMVEHVVKQVVLNGEKSIQFEAFLSVALQYDNAEDSFLKEMVTMVMKGKKKVKIENVAKLLTMGQEDEEMMEKLKWSLQELGMDSEVTQFSAKELDAFMKKLVKRTN